MMADNEKGKWRVLSSQYLIRKPWLTARVDKLELPDGRIMPEYYVLEHCFVATGVEKVSEQHFDEHECLTVHLLDRGEVFKHMNDGSMVQSLMLAPLWRYFCECKL